MYYGEFGNFPDINGFITIIFLVIFGIIIFRVISDIKEYLNNQASERLEVKAKVVGKRIRVSHNGGGVNHHSYSSTRYYVTFELLNGERLEFTLKGKEYGILIEGDFGSLEYQGTRYLGFKRE